MCYPFGMFICIPEILSHWKDLKDSETPKKQQVIKDRIATTREEMIVGIQTDHPDSGWEDRPLSEVVKTWYIWGKTPKYKCMISRDGYQCECPSYEMSGKGLNNKKPCKHLYVLASGVYLYCRTFGE